MQKDRLEEKLRTSLSEYPSPLDLEGAWSKLERTRNKEKKRRGVWFWWLGGAVVLLGIFIITRPDSVEQRIGLAADKLEEMETIPIVKADEPSNTPPQQSIALVERKNPLPSDRTLEDKGFSQVSTAEKQTAELSLTKLPSSDSGPKTFNRGGISDESSDIETPSADDRTRVYAKALVPAMRQSLSTLPSLSIPPLQEVKSIIFEGLPLKEGSFRRIRQGPGSWWIGFSGSVGNQQRSLETNSAGNLGVESLLARREVAEQELEAYSFSFDIRKDFGASWYFQTGLQHQIAFERFEDQYERTFDKVIEDQVTEIVQRADGTTTEIRGDVTVAVTESVVSTIYNTQNLTELPILIGYRQDLTDDLGLDLNLGVLYGFIQRKEGKVHKDANLIGDYETLSQLPYRNSNLWGAQVQTGLFYRLNENWRILGGLQAKLYPNIVDSNADFKEQQMRFNATLGLQFLLGQ